MDRYVQEPDSGSYRTVSAVDRGLYMTLWHIDTFHKGLHRTLSEMDMGSMYRTQSHKPTTLTHWPCPMLYNSISILFSYTDPTPTPLPPKLTKLDFEGSVNQSMVSTVFSMVFTSSVELAFRSHYDFEGSVEQSIVFTVFSKAQSSCFSKSLRF